MLILGCISSVIRFWVQQHGIGMEDFGSTIFLEVAANAELPEFFSMSDVRHRSVQITYHAQVAKGYCSRVAASLYDTSEPVDAAPAVEGQAPEARGRESTRSTLRTLDETMDCDELAAVAEQGDDLLVRDSGAQGDAK